MKKLAVIMLAVCALGASAHAYTLTNPFYMPGEGKFMSDTDLSYTRVTGDTGINIYGLTQTLSYGATNEFQIGADIGYQYWTKDSNNVNGFVNPNIFGFYRFMDEEVKADIGASVTLGLFDNDVEAKDYGYNLIGRVGTNMDNFFIGGLLRLNYTTPDADGADNTFNTELRAYGIYGINPDLGLGGELAWYRNNYGKDYSFNEFEILARADYAIKEDMGIKFYAAYDIVNEDNMDNAFRIGAMLRVLF